MQRAAPGFCVPHLNLIYILAPTRYAGTLKLSGCLTTPVWHEEIRHGSRKFWFDEHKWQYNTRTFKCVTRTFWCDTPNFLSRPPYYRATVLLDCDTFAAHKQHNITSNLVVAFTTHRRIFTLQLNRHLAILWTWDISNYPWLSKFEVHVCASGNQTYWLW